MDASPPPRTGYANADAQVNVNAGAPGASVVYTYAHPPTFNSGGSLRRERSVGGLDHAGGADAVPLGPSAGDLARPVKLLPVSDELTQPGGAQVCKIVHRASGMWLKAPALRLATKLAFTPEYAAGTDFYVCYHEIGDRAGFCVQNPYDGRTLSSDSHCRSWSLSPPRSRGGGDRARDPTLDMTELHLLVRKAGTAELMQLTEYNELEFVASNQLVAAPCLSHAVHATVGDGGPAYTPEVGPNGDDNDGLWLTRNRVHADAFDLFVSKKAQQRWCRHCGAWYDANVLSRCQAPGNVGGQHESFLLPEWVKVDTTARDASLRRQGGGGAGFTELPDAVMHGMLSFLDGKATAEAAGVSKKWHGLSTAIQGCEGNVDRAMVKGLLAASAACTPPPVESSQAVKEAAVQRQGTVLRHAAHVALPELAPALSTTAQANAPWASPSSPVRPQSVTSLDSTSPAHRVTSSTPEGVCLIALVARRVKACLVAHGHRADADLVHLLTTIISRNTTVHSMVAALDQPAKLYPAVYAALSAAGHHQTLRSETLQSLSSGRYASPAHGGTDGASDAPAVPSNLSGIRECVSQESYPPPAHAAPTASTSTLQQQYPDADATALVSDRASLSRGASVSSVGSQQAPLAAAMASFTSSARGGEGKYVPSGTSSVATPTGSSQARAPPQVGNRLVIA